MAVLTPAEVTDKLQELAACVPIVTVRGKARHLQGNEYAIAFDNTYGSPEGARDIFDLLKDAGLIRNPVDLKGKVDLSAVMRGHPLQAGDNYRLQWSKPGDKTGHYEMVVTLDGAQPATGEGLDRAIDAAVGQLRASGALRHLPNLDETPRDWRRHLVQLPPGVDPKVVAVEYVRLAATPLFPSATPEMPLTFRQRNGLTRDTALRVEPMIGGGIMVSAERDPQAGAKPFTDLMQALSFGGAIESHYVDSDGSRRRWAIEITTSPAVMLEQFQLRDAGRLKQAIDRVAGHGAGVPGTKVEGGATGASTHLGPAG